ncbi:MAG: peptidoglycan DD-metalloendopeptidase family protein [Actinomycetota bacterium]|nr:peptidoglycan DD-metalloendopeptidase family protein [Actinomycetota bacterium]MDQ3680856.1 peptidoglycan DD-metalloendopeptidase family protein [Actinomycetota bacterium]
MPKTFRRPLTALIVLVSLAVTQPAGAEPSLDEARRARDAARQKQAQVAAQLNQLEASDAELEAAVGVLTGQVRAQEADVDAASQAVQAAMSAVAAAEERLAATEKRQAQLRQAVVGRAVSAYVRPGEEGFTEVIHAKDLGEASRRRTLLNQVNNNDRNVMDQLRSVGQDLNVQRDLLAKARGLAEQRRMAAHTQLTDLRRAQQDQIRMAGALQGRISEYQQEADLVSQQESGLSTLIRSKEQAAAAQLAAIAQAQATARAAVRGGAPAADPGSDGRVSGAGLAWPLRGPVTSPFGSRWGRLHAGIDISGGTGAPIRAAGAGTVAFAGTMGGYGNAVIINHGGGLSTLYAHQSRLGTGNGASVSQGQVIGFVGSTGHSTGPHLHFETRVGGSPQNPMRFLP